MMMYIQELMGKVIKAHLRQDLKQIVKILKYHIHQDLNQVSQELLVGPTMIPIQGQVSGLD